MRRQPNFLFVSAALFLSSFLCGFLGSALYGDAGQILKSFDGPTARSLRAVLREGKETRHRRFVAYLQIRAGELNQMGCYISLDPGGQKMRDADVSNDAMPAALLSPRIAIGLDHRSFRVARAPDMNLLQDPLHRESRTHDDTLDFYDDLFEDDSKQAVAV